MNVATPSPAQTAPPADARRRRIAGWAGIALGLLIVGGIGAAMSQSAQWSERGALDPESSGPSGTRALAQILREQGLEVRVMHDRESVAQALSGSRATLVMPDAPAVSDDGVRALTDLATDVVLISPRSRTLDLLMPGAEAAGVAADDLAQPACDVVEAVRSGPVEPGAVYSIGGEGTVQACYPSGDGHGLLVAPRGEGRVVAVDARALFANEDLASDGNAALGVGLLGRHPLVVWYVPSVGDTDLADTDPSLGELTPPWVSPVIVLLLIAGVAAAVWRGRRFGPLVTERLPVTVRASETTQGRARLYARSRDSLHAADQLRIGTLGRLGRVLGLGPAASAPDIADAAAARGGFDRGTARRILFDDIPSGDDDLVVLSQQLRTLEDAVHAAIRPERNP